MQKKLTSTLVTLFAFVLLAAALLCVAPKAELAYADAADPYSADAVVELPADGVVAKVTWKDDGTETVTSFGFTAGTATATRAEVNAKLADAWKLAVKYSDTNSKKVPLPEKYQYQTNTEAVKLRIYVDWIAIDGKFGTGDYFDGGELQAEQFGADLLFDLNGHTLDRGSAAGKQYGRVIDFGSDAIYLCLVSLDEYGNPNANPGVITGGWDDEGGAVRPSMNGYLLTDNIVFTGNHAENGGAVYLRSGSKLISWNTEFSHNLAEEAGGAVATESRLFVLYSTMILTNCTLHHNTAGTDGGAILLYDSPETTSTEPNVFENCEMYANTAGEDGGAMFVECDTELHVKGTTKIHGNYAGSEGGGIFLEAWANDAAICHFYNSVAVFGNSAGENGAASDVHLDTGTTSCGTIYVDESFEPSTPTGLRAEDDDQIVVEAANDETTLDTNDFFSNRTDQSLRRLGDKIKALELNGTIGELVKFEASYDPSKVVFETLSIDNDANVVTLLASDANSSAPYVDTLFAKEFEVSVTSVLDNGSSISLNGPLPNTQSIDPNATCHGIFKVWNRDKTSYEVWTIKAIKNSDYVGNYVMTVSVNDVDETFVATDEAAVSVAEAFQAGWNYAATNYKAGSHVTVTLHRDWVARDGSFGEGDGFRDGRISLAGNSDAYNTLKIDLNGFTIDRGIAAKKDNGQVFRVGPHADLAVSGGGLITGGNNNGNGGAFYVESSELVLNEVTIADNKCSGNGGAVFLYDGSEARMQGGVTVECNVANNGGAFGTDGKSGSALYLTGGDISNNSASQHGGAVYWVEKGKLVFNGVEVSGNSAGKNGGAVYWKGSEDLSLLGTNIVNNTAGEHGGGVYAHEDAADPVLGGAIRVFDNTVQGEADNLCLGDTDPNLKHDGGVALTSGAMVGVNMAGDYGSDGSDCISADKAGFYAESTQYFVSDDPAYRVVGKFEGNGESGCSLYLVKDAVVPAEYRADITDVVAVNEETETVTIYPESNSVVITVDAGLRPVYSDTALTSITLSEGATIEPNDYATVRKDYTEPQSFVVTSEGSANMQTWTIQVVPQGGVWENVVTLHRWKDSVKEDLGYVSGFENEVVEIAAEAIGGYTFYGWTIDPEEGMPRYVAEPTVSYTMPACDVVAVASYVRNVDDVEIEGVDVPKAYMPLDTQASTSIEVMIDGANRVVSYDELYVDWVKLETRSGNASKAEPNATYQGTITLRNNAAEGVFFAEGENAVTADIPNAENVNTVVSDGQCVITFTMEALDINVTANLSHTGTFIVDKGTSLDTVSSYLPATLDIQTEAGALPASVTWNCVETDGYKADVPGGYTFKAAFTLPAGVNPNGHTLSGALEVTVFDSTVPMPKASVTPGTYEAAQSVTLSAREGDTITYSLYKDGVEVVASKEYSGPIALESVLGYEKTYVIKATAMDSQNNKSAEAVFEYTIASPVTITVQNGKIAGGNNSGSFFVGDKVDLIATGLTEDNYFVGWFVGGGSEAISTSPRYSFELTDPANATYTAKYADKLITEVSLSLGVPQAGDALSGAEGQVKDNVDGIAVAKVTTKWFAQDADGNWNELVPSAKAERGVQYKAVMTIDGNFAENPSFMLNGESVGDTPDAEWNAEEKTFSYIFDAANAVYESHETPAALTDVPAGSYANVGLPETVKVTTADGEEVDVKVVWAEGSIAAGCTETIEGALDADDLASKYIVGGEDVVVTIEVTAAQSESGDPEGGGSEGPGGNDPEGEGSGSDSDSDSGDKDVLAKSGDSTKTTVVALVAVAMAALAGLGLAARRRLS